MSNVRTGRTAANYKAMQHEAAILYIKEGLSALEITAKLKVSMSTFRNWSNSGNWNDLRPDLLKFKEYKAAHLYIHENLTTGEIAQKLSVEEYQVRIWVFENGWDVTRIVVNSKDVPAAIVHHFCIYFIKLYPQYITPIAIAQKRYSKSIIRKPYNHKL